MSKSSPALYESTVMRHIALTRPNLAPALSKVADYLLRHPLKSATLTIEELAAETKTSPAAVNRLARALNYGGYSGLKAALLETLHELVSPVDKLRVELEQRPSGVFGLQEQLKTSAANLSAAGDVNQEAVFEGTVATLAAARRIYVLGFGNSAYLAGLAAANLVPFCADAIAISMEGGNENAAYRLAAIGEADVLLAISLPRYSLDTVRLARFAMQRGAKVVAITDSPVSPLCEMANFVLYAPVEHPVLTSSNSAALAIIEGLVAAVMARNKEAVRLSAELTESVLSYLYVSTSDNLGPKKRKAT
ncbi:MurR/RpiR family transcriptional regulator [Crenobacter sp. SG2303]|uniref:MurR/RpiR family transcriptional regulator n=1 Tax=Crenobacter oryzisoli TaxID=3056844 RepID=A0ABT7XRS1_9NEIS|nr:MULTISPECIES: MurR/RpiR family transcriptional regulator [unclassified Crenobacter]MDN0076420.1 MurR/RpiR family transcriptional regulator [Crenobacter sp. SG2303]MDN0085647.1 MurR/RpiR family transcriptional regulator [Crenobacter sp. SG2305]